jgi:hypothetical protein
MHCRVPLHLQKHVLCYSINTSFPSNEILFANVSLSFDVDNIFFDCFTFLFCLVDSNIPLYKNVVLPILNNNQILDTHTGKKSQQQENNLQSIFPLLKLCTPIFLFTIHFPNTISCNPSSLLLFLSHFLKCPLQKILCWQGYNQWHMTLQL